jgi:hypothetical protein
MSFQTNGIIKGLMHDGMHANYMILQESISIRITQKEFNISIKNTHFIISHLAIFELSLGSFKNVYYFNLVHVAFYKIYYKEESDDSSQV